MTSTVSSEGGVAGHERHRLVPCLGDEQPVEWIAMMEGKTLDGGDVGQRDGQQTEAVRLTMLDREAVDRGWQLELPQGRLDGHLPDARVTQEAFIVRIGDGHPCGAVGQNRPAPPQERVGVEQEPHSAAVGKIFERSAEVPGHPDAAPRRAGSPSSGHLHERHQLHERLVILGDDDVFAGQGFLKELRESGLGLGDIEYGRAGVRDGLAPGGPDDVRALPPGQPSRREIL
jgi:hypothetical protein